MCADPIATALVLAMIVLPIATPLCPEIVLVPIDTPLCPEVAVLPIAVDDVLFAVTDDPIATEDDLPTEAVLPIATPSDPVLPSPIATPLFDVDWL